MYCTAIALVLQLVLCTICVVCKFCSSPQLAMLLVVSMHAYITPHLNDTCRTFPTLHKPLDLSHLQLGMLCPEQFQFSHYRLKFCLLLFLSCLVLLQLHLHLQAASHRCIYVMLHCVMLHSPPRQAYGLHSLRANVSLMGCCNQKKLVCTVPVHLCTVQGTNR